MLRAAPREGAFRVYRGRIGRVALDKGVEGYRNSKGTAGVKRGAAGSRTGRGVFFMILWPRDGGLSRGIRRWGGPGRLKRPGPESAGKVGKRREAEV